MIYTLEASGTHGFRIGDRVIVSGKIVDAPPIWAWGWPWQDGDRALFMDLYRLFGWSLPKASVPVLTLVTGVTETTLEVKA